MASPVVTARGVSRPRFVVCRGACFRAAPARCRPFGPGLLESLPDRRACRRGQSGALEERVRHVDAEPELADVDHARAAALLVPHRHPQRDGLAVDGDDLVEGLDLPEISGRTVVVAFDGQHVLLVDPPDDPRVEPGAGRDLLDLPGVLAVPLLRAEQAELVLPTHEAQVEVREVRAENRLVSIARDQRPYPAHAL